MSDADKENYGVCAGGPYDGQNLGSDTTHIEMPIEVPGQGLCVGTYTWHGVMHMWIWGYER